MENNEQTEANRAPMTIKSVAVETRLWMVAEATKHGLTMAQWLDRVRETGGQPPRQPVVIPPGQPAPVDPQQALAVAMAAAQVAETLARAGVGLRAAAMRSVLALVAEAADAAGGLPATRPRIAREATGQTGQSTLSHHGGGAGGGAGGSACP